MIDFAGLLRQKRAEADRLEQQYDRRLENPVRMTIAIDQSQAVRERQIIPFEVRVAPNDTVVDGVMSPGAGEGLLKERFEGELSHVHPQFSRYAVKIVDQFDRQGGAPGNSWGELVKHAIRAGEGGRLEKNIWNEAVIRPLNKNHKFGSDFAHDWAVEVAEDAIRRVENTEPTHKESQSLEVIKDRKTAAWVINYKSNIHEQIAPFLGGTLEMIQRTEWMDSQQNAARDQLRQAFEERIAMGPVSKPPPPSAPIKEAFQRQNAFAVLEKLVGEQESVARSGGGALGVGEFIALMNDETAGSGNRAYVADRIRAASPGQHEWIPAGHIARVVAYAIETKGGDSSQTKAAVAWIKAVHMLRTPTDKMVLRDLSYIPAGDSELSVQERISAGTAGKPSDLRRHPPQRGVLKQMVDPFHQILRDFFDEKVGVSSTLTPTEFVEQLNSLLPALLWNGKFTSDIKELTATDEGASELATLLGIEGEGPPWSVDRITVV